MNEKYITYAHIKNPTSKGRYRAVKGSKLPDWAVDVRDEKPIIATIRNPYYTASDGLHDLIEAIKDTHDIELEVLINKVGYAMTELKMKLDEKFIWD